jgi:mannose/fructose/N-acetylgalactosamine-specific phosphotransferase system component IID
MKNINKKYIQEKIGKSKTFNKTILGIFLFIIAATIILRFITSALTDMGYDNGIFHIGFADGSPKSEEFLEKLRDHNHGVLPFE